MAGPSSTSGTTGTTTTTSGSNTMRGSPSPVTSPGPLLMSGQTTPQPSLMHPYGHHHHHQQQQQQQQHSAVTTPIAASSSSAAAATAGVLSRGASSNSLTSLGLNPAAANMLDVSSSFSISGAPGAAGLGGTGSGSGSAATTLYPSASFHASSTSLSMLAADAESTTFGTNMVARLDQQPTCFSIDASGTLGVVASRKGLSIIDLEAPDQPARPLVHHTKWEINDVQWNPHTTRSSYIASTSNTKALIWNAADDRTPLLHVLKTHQRAISDINWSNFDENVLATASVDTYIHVWDIRDPSKPSASLCAWTSGALQVKWNRFNRNLLASAHDGDVRIWDLRKGTAPAVYITGHMAKIYGLDWSRSSENELVSCAQDAKAKLWNITNTRAPQAVIHAGAPIWRARFTPFGNGLLTITLPPPQLRVDNSVLLWSLDNVSAPIHSYNGHSEQVKEFDWRIRGSDDYRDFQLVTCSKDQTMRLWHIDAHDQEACGHTPRGLITTSSRLAARSESVSTTTHLGSGNQPQISHQPQTLSQEFALVNLKIPNVDVEQLNPGARNCVVAVKCGVHLVRLLFTFPSLYPNNAPPSFEFLGGTTVSTTIKGRLKEVLNTTSASYVRLNRSCLEPCLRNLVMMLDGLILSQNEASSDLLATNDENVPFPRLSGAVFSANGTLICFNSLSTGVSNADERTDTPRSLDQLKSYMNEHTIQTQSSLRPSSSAVSVMRSSSNAQRYTPMNERDPSSGGMFAMFTDITDEEPLDFFQSAPTADGAQIAMVPANVPSLPRRDSGLSASELEAGAGISAPAANRDRASSLSQKKRPTLIIKPRWTAETAQGNASTDLNTVVTIRDASALLPFSAELGLSYTLTGNSVVEVCQHNAKAARAVGREDLHQMWSLVALCADERLLQSPVEMLLASASNAAGGSKASQLPTNLASTPADELSPGPWALHPFGRNLLNSLIQHYERIPDVQTLAMLACVFAWPGVKSNAAGWKLARGQHGNLHASRSADSIDHEPSVTSGLLSAMSTSALATARPLSRGAFGATDDQNYAKAVRMLDPSKSNRFFQFIKFYSEVLYGWGYLQARGELLRFLHQPPRGHLGLEFDVKCQICNKNFLRSVRCGDCKRKGYGFGCAICHVPVKGLSNFCVVCGHGGHSEHMRAWFEHNVSCPTGCGCRCTEMEV